MYYILIFLNWEFLFLILQPHPANLFFSPSKWEGMVIECKTQSFWPELPAAPALLPEWPQSLGPKPNKQKNLFKDTLSATPNP